MKSSTSSGFKNAQECLEILSKSKNKDDVKEYTDHDLLGQNNTRYLFIRFNYFGRSPELKAACKGKVELNIDEEARQVISDIKDKSVR